jgi:hypothetical protein
VLVCLYDNQGGGGSPGNLLAEPFLSSTGARGEWELIPVPHRAKIEEGEDFYLGIMQELVFPNCNAICVDAAPDTIDPTSWMMDPLTEQWSVLDDRYGDLLVKALVTYTTDCSDFGMNARSTPYGLQLLWEPKYGITGYDVFTEGRHSNHLRRLNTVPLENPTFLDRTIERGKSRVYRIGLIHPGNTVELSSPHTFFYLPSDRHETGKIRLYSPSPNPFNPLTQIAFSLPRETHSLKLYVFDISGRLVRKLADNKALAMGRHTLLWDGKNDHDRELPTGIYICRLIVEDRTEGTRKLLLLK